MNLKFNNKIIFISIFLCLFIFTGCSDTNVLLADTDGGRTFYEFNLEEGNIFVTSDEYTIGAGNTIYITGISQNDSISMYKRVVRAFSFQDIDVDIKLYENGTQYSTTPIETFNKNRNSDKNSTFTIYQSNNNTSSITGATELPFANKLKGDKDVVVSSLDTADYIMKKNTVYILEITNNAPQSVNLILYWNWILLK